MEERALVDRLIRGEPLAWETLVDEYGPAVHEAASFTLRRVLAAAPAEDVENVVSAVFVALCDKSMHRLRLFQGRSSLRTWLTSVTTRYALNYIRTEKRKGALRHAPLDPGADVAARDADLLSEFDERERLYAAIERIPFRERLVLKLFHFDGLPYKAIARALRIPVNSISPLLLRARDSIRREIARLDGEAPGRCPSERR